LKININVNKVEDAIGNEGKPSVFIIEDNPDMLLYLRNKLKTQYNVFVAENGIKALEKLKNIQRPDLFISDVMMDEMNGFDFFKSISVNTDYKHIPLIFLTAKTTTFDKFHGLTLGAIDYIHKPFSISELLIKVESIIGNVRKQKEAILNSALHYLNNQKELPRNEAEIRKTIFDNNCETYNITEREKEIVILTAEGLTYKKISQELNISINTLITHRGNLFKKLKVKSKVALIKKLYE
jgi:DNA-binding NarL/FixJ family response regulator